MRKEKRAKPRTFEDEHGHGHAELVRALSSRLREMRVIQRFWERGDLRAAIAHATKIYDQEPSSGSGAAYDFLKSFQWNPSAFNLEAFADALPMLADMLRIKFTRVLEGDGSEEHMQVVLTAIQVSTLEPSWFFRCLAPSLTALDPPQYQYQTLMRNFSNVIKDSLRVGVGGGIDLQREKRLSLSKLCHHYLVQVRKEVAAIVDEGERDGGLKMNILSTRKAFELKLLMERYFES